MIRRFHIDVPDETLNHIQTRVAEFPWHEMPDDGGWEYGVNLDYMREFCNLTVGAIKIWVSDRSAGNEYGKTLLVNLPFTIPGTFESGHHPGKSLSLNHIYDCWSMSIGSGHSFICSSEIEVRNWVQVSQIATTEPVVEPEDDDDEIDFL